MDMDMSEQFKKVHLCCRILAWITTILQSHLRLLSHGPKSPACAGMSNSASRESVQVC